MNQGGLHLWVRVGLKPWNASKCRRGFIVSELLTSTRISCYNGVSAGIRADGNQPPGATAGRKTEMKETTKLDAGHHETLKTFVLDGEFPFEHRAIILGWMTASQTEKTTLIDSVLVDVVQALRDTDDLDVMREKVATLIHEWALAESVQTELAAIADMMAWAPSTTFGPAYSGDYPLHSN